MAVFSLERVQFLPINPEQAWAFFSSPANLQKITPPEMGFIIRSELPERMYPGLIISYTVKPLYGIPVRWVTEISQVQEPHYFVDTQLSGPYVFWHHQHHFKEVEGGIEMKDILHYKLPFGFVGNFAHRIFLRKKIEGIFNYRFRILEENIRSLIK
jgi:ligand-binding SRPBCC domain-containing protein